MQASNGRKRSSRRSEEGRNEATGPMRNLVNQKMRTMRDINPRPSLIDEMANNHMGNVENGIRIVRKLKAAPEGFPFGFCAKSLWQQ